MNLRSFEFNLSRRCDDILSEREKNQSLRTSIDEYSFLTHKNTQWKHKNKTKTKWE